MTSRSVTESIDYPTLWRTRERGSACSGEEAPPCSRVGRSASPLSTVPSTVPAFRHGMPGPRQGLSPTAGPNCHPVQTKGRGDQDVEDGAAAPTSVTEANPSPPDRRE